MRSVLVLTAAVALACHAGCAGLPRKAHAAPRAAEDGLAVISEVGVHPKTARPGQEAVVRWRQSRQAQISLDIRAEDGPVVRRLAKRFAQGRQELSWDEKDDTGQAVPSGVYVYALRSRTATGETVYDPSASSGGEELNVERFGFDGASGLFEFVLPRAARARLRVGLTPFLYLRTLLDWQPMEAGRHTLAWDGLDASGWIRAKDHPNLTVNLAAFALPDNVVMVADQAPDRPASHPSLGRGAYLHARHPRNACRDISLQVELPGALRTPEGVPILQDHTLVRVSLQEPDKAFMVNQRFEVVFAVDTVFLFEEEDGQDPLNFEWDTTGLAAGEHLFTVNVIGYEDHLGVATVRVMKPGAT